MVGVFRGEPLPKEVIWTGQGYVDADSAEGRDLVRTGSKVSLRVSINVYCLDDGNMRVFEMGVQTFKEVVAVREKYGLGGAAFEVSRHGAKGDAKTKYRILFDHALSDAECLAIEKASLHDLSSSGDDEVGGAGDGLVTETQGQLLLKAFGTIDVAAGKPILARFGASRIRELKAADVQRVLAEIDAVNAGPGADLF